MNAILLILVFVLTFALLFCLYVIGSITYKAKAAIERLAKETNTDAVQILHEIGLK